MHRILCEDCSTLAVEANVTKRGALIVSLSEHGEKWGHCSQSGPH